MLFHIGVRHNNSDAILTAKSKLKNLFFVCNHPTYKNTFYEFFKLECLILPTIKNIIHDSLSVSKTTHDN